MHLDLAIAHIGRDGARREGDRIGVNHLGDVAALAARDALQHRIDIDRGRQHLARDDQRPQDDLPGEPQQIKRQTPQRDETRALMVKNFHAQGDCHRKRRADGAGNQEKGCEMAGQNDPGAVQHREQADRVQQFSLREAQLRETLKFLGN